MKIYIIIISLFICISSNQSYAYNAGFRKIIYQDNQIGLWYPSDKKEHPISYMEYTGNVVHNSELSSGIFPMLIFSHGFQGGMYNQSYLAEFMARNGYIVATIEHNDKKTLKTLVNRPIAIKKALDLILKDITLNNHINLEKIGMLGHSLGGYTSFVIAGGEPDFNNHFSLNWLPKFLKKFYLKIKNFDNNFYDSRVKSIAVLAPGLGTLFNKEHLSKVSIPVLIIEAEKDEVVLDGSASLYKNNLPKEPDHIILKGSRHYSFLPLCNEYLQKNYAEICYDPDTSRNRLHNKIQQQVLSFFNKTLKISRTTDSPISN
jgi:predicted dienelactone hydrolase